MLLRAEACPTVTAPSQWRWGDQFSHRAVLEQSWILSLVGSQRIWAPGKLLCAWKRQGPWSRCGDLGTSCFPGAALAHEGGEPTGLTEAIPAIPAPVNPHRCLLSKPPPPAQLPFSTALAAADLAGPTRHFFGRETARQGLMARGSGVVRNISLSCEGQCPKEDPLQGFPPSHSSGSEERSFCALTLSPALTNAFLHGQFGRGCTEAKTTQRPRLGCSIALLSQKRGR